MGTPEAPATVNAFRDDVRASGPFPDTVTRRGIVRIEATLPGALGRHGSPG